MFLILGLLNLAQPAPSGGEAAFLVFNLYKDIQTGAFPETILTPVYPLLLSLFSARQIIFVLRSLNVFFGLVALWMFYRMVRQHLGKGPAFIAALLLSCSPFFVSSCVTIQPYTLALVFGLLLIHTHIHYENKTSQLLLIVLAGALFELTILPGFLFLAIYGICALFLFPKEKSKPLLIAVPLWLSIQVMFVFFAWKSVDGLFASLFYIEPFNHLMRCFPRTSALLFKGTVVSTGLSAVVGWVGLASQFGLLIFLFIPVFRKLNSRELLVRKSVMLCTIALFLPVFLCALFQFGDIRSSFLILTPAILLLVSLGIGKLPKILGVLVTGLLVGIFLFQGIHYSFIAGQKGGVTEAIQQIMKLPGQTMILFYPPEIMADFSWAWPKQPTEPIIRKNGFFNNGKYHLKDDYANYRWEFKTSKRGGNFPFLSTVDSGMFALFSPAGKKTCSIQKQPVLLNGRFALLDHQDFLDSDLQYGLYFGGSHKELLPLLTDAQAMDLAKSAKPSPTKTTTGNDVLLDRLKLSLRYMNDTLDEKMGFIPYFHHDLVSGKKALRHANWDWCDISSRYALAMSKGDAIAQGIVDQKRLFELEKTILLSIRKDGLAYRQDTDFSDLEADIFDQGSVLLYLIEKYNQTRDSRIKSLMDGIVASLLEKASPSASGLRFPFSTVLPDGTKGIGKDNWPEADPCHHGGRLLFPLALMLERFPQDDNPVSLFDGIAGFIVQDSKVFRPDGSFSGHTHARTNTLLGLAIRAMQTGDPKLMQFVKKHVTWLVDNTPQWGWVPEFMPEKNQNHPENRRAETDALVDLIRILMILAKQDSAYWDIVDRYVQNGLLAAQLSDDKGLRPSPIGAFCGFCTPNSFGKTTMNCCTPAGAQLLADLHKAAVIVEKEQILINLLFERDDAALSISREEKDKRLVWKLRPKQSGNVKVRLPSFVNQDGLHVNSDHTFTFEAGLLTLINIPKGGEVVFDYPLPERTESFKIADSVYLYHWLGNEVIGVTPAGPAYPFFNERQ